MATIDELRAEARGVQAEAGDEYTTRVALIDWAADEIERLRDERDEARKAAIYALSFLPAPLRLWGNFEQCWPWLEETETQAKGDEVRSGRITEIERLRAELLQRDRIIAESTKQLAESQATLDSVLARDEQTVHRDVVRLREQNHELRGLLETAVDAWESATSSHRAEGVVWITPDWYKRACELLAE